MPYLPQLVRTPSLKITRSGFPYHNIPSRVAQAQLHAVGFAGIKLIWTVPVNALVKASKPVK